MTYTEALKKISSLERFGSKPGLERIQKLLQMMWNPQDSLKYVHVAGTNGKGSTCALIASVLEKARYKTGLFISPYVTDFCERMQINGEKISHEELAEMVGKVFPLVERMNQNGEIITEFELVTALAFAWFAQKGCDIVVLEVGLGGRLDSTNVIQTPLVSVITSISSDHTKVLGNTLAQIAYEKSGIIKDGGVTVCYPEQKPEVLEILQKTADKRNNRFVLADMKSVVPLSMNLNGTGLLYGELLVHLPFLGEHQIKNAVTALAALEVLKEKGYHISGHSFESGFASASFPARMEVLSMNPTVILDGAHNPDGMAALAATVRKYLPDKKITAIVGMLSDKDVKASVENLAGLFSNVITLVPKNPRAMSAEDLAEHFRLVGTPAESMENSREALKKALSVVGKEGTLFVCGSLYLAGELRPLALDLLSRK
ncbi:bifunctional folylpolyglutamate synthase/dihydrofolate synthase [Caproiciproducens galactitolivorans]|uniref:tetrahydrofolate synthase n=1 Tax=Caproiciproducens galactitolivorans TaxID=642589 RepID=A0A4Z0Y9H5_9FIRM|nr:folylpolyglutamate synthase/dihydrofolate synthase family protein [Caproiciproducens galactitolivorans]QEY33808.1 bifunctional folylpolyglutamate synthase/dihydrofolate synthase [Caproiciproducens galactitolivorans]TGJ75610.1 folylpolyglutamate synthase [Caproiciproducens galactitolivorans]